MKITKGNLAEKYATFSNHWHPHVIGELNGQSVKIAKVQGEFTWHTHTDEDEMFLVIKGQLKISLRDSELILNEGDYAIIPRGVEHKPSAEHETQILMFEPNSTLNTGNVENEMTVKNLKKI